MVSTMISVQSLYWKTLNPQELIYLNPNIAQEEQRNVYLYPTKLIQKGTVILIEEPWKSNNCIDPRKRRAHSSWNGFLFSSLPMIKVGLSANIELYQDYDNNNTIIAVAIADIQPNQPLIRPINFMKVLMHSPQSELLNFSVNDWITMNQIYLNETHKIKLNQMKNHFERLTLLIAAGVDKKEVMISDDFEETMSAIYENKAGQEAIATRVDELSYFDQLHNLMFIIFDRVRLHVDDARMANQMEALIENQEMYTILCKDSEFVKWFFNLKYDELENLVSLPQSDGIHYQNSKIGNIAESGKLLVTEDIKMGTILLIERPWTASDSNAKVLMEADDESSMLYSSLESLQFGLHSNIAISKDEHGNIFMMSTCDLSAGEYLIKPIDFFKALELSNGSLDVDAWKERFEKQLSDEDNFMLDLLWKYFENMAEDFEAQWIQNDQFGDGDFEGILNSRNYEMIRLLMHQHGFNPIDWKYGNSAISPLSASDTFRDCVFFYNKLDAITYGFNKIVDASGDNVNKVRVAVPPLRPWLEGDDEFAHYICKRNREENDSDQPSEPIAKKKRLENQENVFV